MVKELARKMLLANELGSNPELAYRFSQASEESGWSFGVCQFDTLHNWTAIRCLEACRFTPKELRMVLNKDSDNIAEINEKLMQHKEIIDEYDEEHIDKSFHWCSILLNTTDIHFDLSGLLAVTDYHNQFSFDRNGKLHKWLLEQKKNIVGFIVTVDTITDFKLQHTKWGKKRPDDVKRRANNIKKILNNSKNKEVFV